MIALVWHNGYAEQITVTSSHTAKVVSLIINRILHIIKAEKGKGIAVVYCHNLHTATAPCDTQSAYSLGLSLSPPRSYVALVCRLMVSTPIIHVFARITNHLPIPEEWTTELADQELTVYPQSGNLSTIDRAKAGKAYRRKTDVLTREPRRHHSVQRLD